MTDNEIIKALKCCISTTTDKACVGCPFNKQKVCDKDQWALEKYAFDLINRQKAENSKLFKKIKQLKLQNNLMASERELHKIGASKLVLKIKTEAYKEFANLVIKRICEKVTAPTPNESYIVEQCNEQIYSLLKEMVGEEK